MGEQPPDHIEFKVKPVDLAVVKEVALGAIDWLAGKLRPDTPFASHGDHLFEHPDEAGFHPLVKEELAHMREHGTVPDVAGLDLRKE